MDRTRPFLGFFGGLLVAASLPPWGFWPLAFFGIAALELALGDWPSRRVRFIGGFSFGLGWLAPGMAWMWFLTPPGYIVATLIFSALHGLAALAAPRGRWRIIGRPAAHAIAEAIRFVFPFGGVPLASLAISQSVSPIAVIARLGGAVLLTWFALQIGFIIGFARRRMDTVLVAALGILLVVGSICAVSPSGYDNGQALVVAVVQGGGEQGTRAISSDASEVFRRHLDQTKLIGVDKGVDMVVWPENVVDVDDILFTDSDELKAIARQARRLDAPILVGITEDDGPTHFVNAQVVVSPDGDVISRYDKVRRVPFGEYMPMRGLLDAIGAPTNLVPRDATAGTQPAVLTLPDGTPVAVAISWEIFFGGRVRDGVSRDGQMLLNPTNGSSYTWTVLQTQQINSSRLRAIESGRWVVQAAPTGFSAFISPNGDVFSRTSVSEAEVIIYQVPLRQGQTWYTDLGDIIWVALMAAMLAISWLLLRLDLQKYSDRPLIDKANLHFRPKATRRHGGTDIAELIGEHVD